MSKFPSPEHACDNCGKKPLVLYSPSVIEMESILGKKSRNGIFELEFYCRTCYTKLLKHAPPTNPSWKLEGEESE
jgi:hypothetical protein